jgi:hypothetical protein
MKKMKFGQIMKSLPLFRDPSRAESRGFYLADAAENGASHEVLPDLNRPSTSGGKYLIRSSMRMNEWHLVSSETGELIMIAVIHFESKGKFTTDFGVHEVIASGNLGRVRISMYVSGDENSSSNKKTTSEPIAVIMSTPNRVSWTGCSVTCDACSYRRRRSSFTEVMPPIDPSSPIIDCGSPCSFNRDRHLTESDFGDVCSVMPSLQQFIKIEHSVHQIFSSPFTQMHVSTGAGCPLMDRTNSVPSMTSSRPPVWSEKLKALSLEFKHRKVMPSRRNF